MGKMLYGSLFCLVLPAWMIVWAILTRDRIPVRLQGIELQMVGGLLAVSGMLLQVVAMRQLWLVGRGLPMNAYPPEQYVATGIYRYVRHPIYVGFVLCCAGVSLMCLSSSGLFLVTPVLALMCVALVVGYEAPDLASRFGVEAIRQHAPLLGPPRDAAERADLLTRVAAGLIVFVPWVLLYYWLIFLGDSPHFVTLALPGEESWPVVAWTELFYFLTYPFVVLAPLVLRRQDQVRQFVQTGWWIIGWGIFLEYTLPIHAPPRPFAATTMWGELLLWERSMDGPVCAFPSFHVMWALVAASFWTVAYPAGRWVWWLLAGLISMSCVTTGNHTVADVAAGVVVFGIVQRRVWWWAVLQRMSERLANSWHAWQVGPLRIINHSVYAGLACAVGIFVLGQFLAETVILVLLAVMILVSACVWGQWVTGSAKLLRPFGYYGAVLGAVGAAWLITLMWQYHWISLCGMAALAAPWVQAIGRLRCLVQGCCHGKATESVPGIRCSNPHSRVCALSGLGGVMIHNTQLYSIASNIVTGMLLWRLWYAGIAPAMLAGLYGILNGAFRFMEEAYRGEVQTQVIGKLKLYQWLSVGSIVAGMVLTCVPGPATLEAQWRCDVSLVVTSVGCGMLAAFLMGMDFPQSTRRFARLSG